MNAPNTPVTYGNTNSKLASFCPQYHFFGSLLSSDRLSFDLLSSDLLSGPHLPVTMWRHSARSHCKQTKMNVCDVRHVSRLEPHFLSPPAFHVQHYLAHALRYLQLRYGICSISIVDKMTYLVRVKRSIGRMKRRRFARS